MSRPLHLFIRPPYRPSDTPPGSWQLRLGYGAPLPAGLRLSKGELSEVILLEADAGNARLCAAATGHISTRFPDDHPPEPQQELPPADLSQPEPERVTIYLHPRPFLDLNPGFTARAQQLLHGPGAGNGTFSFASPAVSGSVTGFFYLNVDAASLKATLRARSAAPGSLEATLPPALSDYEFEELWRHFLSGKVDIFVAGGDHLAEAASPIIDSANPNTRQVGFAVLTADGTHDSAHFYDWMRAFLVDEADLDGFLGLVPPVWPLIDENLPIPEAIELTRQHLFPYRALKKLRERGLTAAEWRRVGDYQKSLYRESLLARAGHAAASSATLPFFEFNDCDWQNPFQLEAVVEFYMNFDDPWDISQVPREPAPDQVVDFTPLSGTPAEGTAAEVDGNTIRLDGDLDLNKIWVGRDTIVLHESHQTLRIIDADPDTHTITVANHLPPGDGLSWHINQRPVLVLIDSFGTRLSGRAATISSPVAGDPFRPTGPDTLVLDGVNAAQMRRIRENFTTIYLYADTSNGGPQPRTYRIRTVDVQRRIVTLDGSPDIPADGTAWHLPAGIGGRLPGTHNLLTRSDDYDGVLFVVHNGEVLRRYRWTSYTSRCPADLQQRSSVRGNRKYYIASFKSGGSGASTRNFCFMVEDTDAYIWGRGATVAAAGTVTLPGADRLDLIESAAAAGDERFFIFLYNDQNNPIGGYWIDTADAAASTVTFQGNPSFDGADSSWRVQLYDGVHEARHYFEETVTADTAPADQAPGAAGKRLIRLHYGRGSGNCSGSEGCLVSPHFYEMRNFLIELYQAEYRAMRPDDEPDEEIQSIYENGTHAQNVADFAAIDAARWNNKIVGTLWLIRPHERPLG